MPRPAAPATPPRQPPPLPAAAQGCVQQTHVMHDVPVHVLCLRWACVCPCSHLPSGLAGLDQPLQPLQLVSRTLQVTRRCGLPRLRSRQLRRRRGCTVVRRLACRLLLCAMPERRDRQ